LVICLTLFGCSTDNGEPVEEVQTAGSVRNLVLICIDTVRADLFYALGDAQGDPLGPWQADAVVFEQASSAAPWTLPSVASVLTGLWPVQHGLGQLPGRIKNIAKDFRPTSTRAPPCSPRYTGHGHTLYQEILHVPLMVWHPGFEGMSLKQPVSLIDIAPTAARWLGIEYMPDQWQGRFLDDYLYGVPKKGSRIIYASGVSRGEAQISARQGAKKGIWYPLSNLNRYFDLSLDPLERQSVETTDLVMRFDGLYLDYAQSRPDKEINSTTFTENHIKRLQSIGYLQGVESGEMAN